MFRKAFKPVLAVLAVLSLLLGAFAPPDFEKLSGGRGEVYLVFHPGGNSLETLTHILSIDRVAGDSVFAYANEKEFNELRALGLAYRILTPPSMPAYPVDMASAAAFKTTQAWNTYPTYQAYETLMVHFQQQYPSLCRLHVLGTLPSGRRILALRITDHPDSVEAEPEFLYTSSMHGDELTGYILTLRLADYLLDNYDSLPEVTRLVDSVDIWINPLANPDGTYRFGNQTVYGATRYNANYVDINRNFPDAEDGPHPDGNAWQPETQIFMNFAAAHHFSMSANIHGGAEVCNYPWDTWSRFAADNAWWVYVCNQYADTAQSFSPAGYLDDFGTGITNGYAWYSISGGRQDYMNYFHQCREFTLEISNTKLPLASTLPNYWNYNYRSLLNYMGQSLNGLHGMVTDSLTGEALRARVDIIGHDLDSSHVYAHLPHGDYFRYLGTGIYNITFSAAGYIPRTISGINVTMGVAQRLDVRLVREGIVIQGEALYDGPVRKPLAGAWIILGDAQGITLDSARADTAGYFILSVPDTGNYQLSLSPVQAWGGINSFDALRAMQHFAQMIPPLEGLVFSAADVNATGIVNATDALRIQKRFVGLDSTFLIPDWLSLPRVVHLQSDTFLTLKALCAGDVDQSYTP